MERQLVIIAGPERGRTFPLEDGQTLVIGRGQASDTQINDPHMSRVHCRVQVDGGQTLLVDDGSSAGTTIGGNKITRHELQPGEVFQVGDTQIRYQLGGEQDATTLGGDQAFGRPKPKPKIAPLEQLVGQTLAHFRLDGIIATGNSGMVFKAKDTEKDQLAAVKVLTPDPSHSEEQKERFVRAMKTMLPVRHPHIVELYHAGKRGPYCFAAMEYIDGESMTHVIERIGIEGMLDWTEAYRVAVHIGRALQVIDLSEQPLPVLEPPRLQGERRHDVGDREIRRVRIRLNRKLRKHRPQVRGTRTLPAQSVPAPETHDTLARMMLKFA